MRVERLRAMAARYENSWHAPEKELARMSKLIVGKWDAAK
jgi:hypothetical protein